MKRASYRDAVNWLALNDDNEWLNVFPFDFSVSASLIRDIFEVDEVKLREDIRREVRKDPQETAA
jgi:hypothetical protein